jgi:hypothetical protein
VPWVPSSTIARVSASPPAIPDGRFSRIRFWPWHPLRPSRNERRLVFPPYSSWFAFRESIPLSSPSSVSQEIHGNQPSAQGAFAYIGCYPLQWSLSGTIGGHYSAFIAHTRPCARPTPSSRLRLRLIQDVFAGRCRPLPGVGPSRHYLRESFATCQVPYPGGSPWCFCPFLPMTTSAFPQSSNGRLSHLYPYSNFSMGGDFGVADIPLCSGLPLCSPLWLLLPTIHHREQL